MSALGHKRTFRDAEAMFARGSNWCPLIVATDITGLRGVQPIKLAIGATSAPHPNVRANANLPRIAWVKDR
jgi:hypothetical protein